MSAVTTTIGRGYRYTAKSDPGAFLAWARQLYQERERERETRRKEKRAEARKRYAKEHPEIVKVWWRADAGTQKGRARAALKRAVRWGRLQKPSVCQDCGRSDLQIHGHHHDYDKPLDVIWVCSTCHGKRHRRPDIEKAG